MAEPRRILPALGRRMRAIATVRLVVVASSLIFTQTGNASGQAVSSLSTLSRRLISGSCVLGNHRSGDVYRWYLLWSSSQT